MTEIEDVGQGQAHPAVPLGLDHADRPGLGDPEVDARLTATIGLGEELGAEVGAGGVGEGASARRSGARAPNFLLE